MAYTTPKTWAYKESVSSSDLNTYVRDNFIALIDMFYPIGTIYTNKTVSTNPATLLGFGTWVEIQGRVIVGVGTSDRYFAVSETGGESTHVLITAELASHRHGASSDGGTDNSSGSYFRRESGNVATINTQYAGSNNAHNNLQPYQTAYIWERIA
jgi:microcystin-dependent protein